MVFVNKVQLIGEVCSQTEFSNVNGNALARFMLLTCDYYLIDGKRFIDRQIHRIVVAGNQALLVKNNLERGDEIVIDGSITTRKISNDRGEITQLTEVVVHNILFPFTKRA
ncbi:MAG TPA: single-stranded DNA-binding protein [Bacteroidales bacterium]|nr:single-stranded DNA-binding protein [Bacteroidales bacterium]